MKTLEYTHVLDVKEKWRLSMRETKYDYNKPKSKPDMIEYYNKQISLTISIISTLRQDDPYKTVKAEALRNRLAKYKEELQRLRPDTLNAYIKQ